MSGGYFDHRQWILDDIADQVDRVVENNNSEETDEWGGVRGRRLPEPVLEKFRETSRALKRTGVMVQRLDWLLSGDDSPETFLLRWAETVEKNDG